MDVSRSIDRRDYRVLTGGLADALVDPAVRRAFLSGDAPVALSIYEWSGVSDQTLIQDWVLIGSATDLDRISNRIRGLDRQTDRHLTALGAALSWGRAHLDRAPPCRNRVIDVAGDGQNNEGPPPAAVYRREDWQDITVNGLAIGEHESFLLDYFGRELIRGPGAFVEFAPRQQDFPAAIRRKLIRELSDQLAFAAP